MTPELRPLPSPLPDRLRWRYTQRRTAWLFDELNGGAGLSQSGVCVGTLGFGGYGRASGLTSRGVWHLHRLGVLHLGINIAPADGRHPPLLMRQTWSFDGTLDLPGPEPVDWRAFGTNGQSWIFERASDHARLFVFTAEGDLQTETAVQVCPAAHALADATPLLLLGAFLVKLAVDDSVVIAGT